MGMARVPKLAELRAVPACEPIADLFEALGITDDDFPDEMPDDLNLNDPVALQRHLPAVHAKIAERYAAAGLDFPRGDST